MLRPLRIGEIFDRAVTLCVANFVPFAIVALFYVVPMAVAGIFQQRDTAQSWQAMIAVMRGHGASVPRSGTNWGLQIGVIAWVALAGPFAHMAIAAAVGQRYRDSRVDWRAAMVAALQQWAPVIGLMLFGIITLVTAVFGGSIGLGLVIGVSAVAFAASKAASIVFGILAILLFLAWLLALMVLAIAILFMFLALVIERSTFITAIGSGFTRIFNRRELLRALAMALAFMAIELGLTLISYTVIGVVDIWWHAFVAGAVALSLVNLLTVIFSATLFTVYYFDVRLRREALDMQQPAQPFVPATQG